MRQILSAAGLAGTWFTLRGVSIELVVPQARGIGTAMNRLYAGASAI